MAAHERFNLITLDDLRAKCATLGVDIPITEDLSLFGSSTTFDTLDAPNRLVVHPMEGCDGDTDGTPGPLTVRKYEHFAAGGAGMLWLEACAVVPEGRANPRQLWLTEANLPAYRDLVQRIHASAQAAMGADHRPILVLQLTHSGRYSRPAGAPAPLIGQHSPLDAGSHVTPDTPVVSDEYLDALLPAYVTTSRLAREAGFDAVDIKACHGYLLNEVLAAVTREGSRHGGVYDNRVSLLFDIVRAIRSELPDLAVTGRLNLYDALPYPFGWGVAHDALRPDLTEPLRLIGQLMELGVGGLNVTIGNPYAIPYLSRPHDAPLLNTAPPPEHPLESLARIIDLTAQVQRAHPRLALVGFGYSWLRHLAPYVMAGVLANGGATLAGLGRGALAYPDFARDILQHGSMDAKKTCIACSSCSQMMRDGTMSGCPVRDSAIYRPLYRAGRAQHR